MLNIIYIESIGSLIETEQFYLTALVTGMIIILYCCIYSREHFLPFALHLAFEDFIFCFHFLLTHSVFLCYCLEVSIVYSHFLSVCVG